MELSEDIERLKSVSLILLIFLFFGCGPEKIAKKEPFFEKWSAMAEEAPGHSPAPRSRIIIYPDAKKPADTGAPAKSLPQERVTLKMRQADVKAVIRSLARTSGQNILVRNEVKGDINVDFTNVPWDQAFISILRAQGLSFVWDGEISGSSR